MNRIKSVIKQKSEQIAIDKKNIHKNLNISVNKISEIKISGVQYHNKTQILEQINSLGEYLNESELVTLDLERLRSIMNKHE